MPDDSQACPECRAGTNYLTSPPTKCGHCGGTGRVLDDAVKSGLQLALLERLPGIGKSESHLQKIADVQTPETHDALEAKFYAEKGIDIRTHRPDTDEKLSERIREIDDRLQQEQADRLQQEQADRIWQERNKQYLEMVSAAQSPKTLMELEAEFYAERGIAARPGRPDPQVEKSASFQQEQAASLQQEQADQEQADRIWQERDEQYLEITSSPQCPKTLAELEAQFYTERGIAARPGRPEPQVEKSVRLQQIDEQIAIRQARDERIRLIRES